MNRFTPHFFFTMVGKKGEWTRLFNENRSYVSTFFRLVLVNSISIVFYSILLNDTKLKYRFYLIKNDSIASYTILWRYTPRIYILYNVSNNSEWKKVVKFCLCETHYHVRKKIMLYTFHSQFSNSIYNIYC